MDLAVPVAWFSREEKQKGWLWVLGSFSWLAAFQKSPIIGDPGQQGASIKESINTSGLVAALVVTITAPIAMNPNDVGFEPKSDFWGADVQIFDATTAETIYFYLVYFSVIMHIISIAGSIFASLSFSCLNDDLLPKYIEEVGSMALLFPILTLVLGCVSVVFACFIIGFRTFGVFHTIILVVFVYFGMVPPLVRFLYCLVKNLYTVPSDIERIREEEINKMHNVKPENVACWLKKMKTDHFTKDFKEKKQMDDVAGVFTKEGISGLALSGVDMDFLKEKCTFLSYGDAYLLLQEIELRKGAVIGAVMINKTFI